MADAVIVSTARTPIGKAFRGIFNDTHGADMGAHVIKHAAERAKVELGEVEDVILGCAAPEGTTGSNVARVSAMRAGAPVSVSGVTVNRFCSSGLQTISMAAQRVLVDKVPVMIAGGLESVSLVQGPPGGNKNRLVNPVGAGARARHLPRHDHHRRHGGGALQDQPRGAGRVFAAEPDAHRGGPAGRQVRRRDRADGNHDAGHRQEHPGSLEEDGQAHQGRGQPSRHQPGGPRQAAAGGGSRQVDHRRQCQPALRRRLGRA